MEENKLDQELQRINKNLLYLWKDYDFHVRFFTRSYGMYNKGFIIGLENGVCKLLFEKETNSIVEPIRIYVGAKSAQFTPPDNSFLPINGWYTVAGLIYWLTGIECERYKNVDQDLESISIYLKLNMDRILDLFRIPDEFDRKLQYYKNLYKENQITVQKIREERSRLQALGQDSSLEAAILSLRRGNQ